MSVDKLSYINVSILETLFHVQFSTAALILTFLHFYAPQRQSLLRLYCATDYHPVLSLSNLIELGGGFLFHLKEGGRWGRGSR